MENHADNVIDFGYEEPQELVEAHDENENLVANGYNAETSPPEDYNNEQEVAGSNEMDVVEHRGEKLDLLNQHRLEAEAFVENAMQKFEQECTRREEEIKQVHEASLEILNHHTQEYMNSLKELRCEFTEKMSQNVEEFVTENNIAVVEIDRLSILQQILKDVMRQFGL